MAAQQAKEPRDAWVVVFAGTAINLCLGILYAWSVWKKALVNKPKADAGVLMDGINAGWPYLTDAQGTVAYFVCGLVFAIFMIPGGRIQDKYGPKVGATLGGLLLAAGCIVAGLMKSYTGLLIGFGVLGGIGMGIGYAAPTPAALKWFGAHRRGLIVGLVVGGYGAAALYISPLAQYLINNFGISNSFLYLGIFFAVVVILAGQLLKNPPEGYVPAGAPVITPTAGSTKMAGSMAAQDWAPSEMVSRWQYFALVFMFIGSAQSGLLVIANAAPILAKCAGSFDFFVRNAWIIAAFGGLVNALGRVGTGLYSDKIGRQNAYTVNGIASVICLFLAPWIINSNSILLLFIIVGIAYWQYGGGLALMPSFTADFFGSKNLGANYGLVFIGWGLGFMVPLMGGYLKDWTGNYALSFYISAVILLTAVIIGRLTHRPRKTAQAVDPIAGSV